MEPKERPILFSGPMVRAILAEQKTQTRRLMKCRMPQDRIVDMLQYKDADKKPTGEWGLCSHERVISEHIRCPYGAPGDRLWVRESGWQPSTPTAQQRRDGADTWPEYWYSADGVTDNDRYDFKRWGWKHRPSIHMPRWASRIILEVTEVRIERPQNISAADAVAEGCDSCTPYDQFRALWTFIHTADGPNGWAANPLVWVVGFRMVDA